MGLPQQGGSMGRYLMLIGQVGVGCCATLKVQSYYGTTAAHSLVASTFGPSRETARTSLVLSCKIYVPVAHS